MAEHDLAMWQGRRVVDPEGDKIGTVDDLFVDEESRKPEWLFVDTGVFGKNVFVPAGESRFPDDDTVQVPYTKDQVKDAPDIAVGDTLSTDDERRLYDYYGLGASEEQAGSTPPEQETVTSDQGPAAGGRDLGEGHESPSEEAPTSVSSAGSSMAGPSGTVSSVDTQSGSPGSSPGTSGRERVRVKKRVVTEPKTVYVEREEIVVERRPAGSESTGEAASPEGDVREEVLYEDEITPEHEVDRGEEHAA